MFLNCHHCSRIAMLKPMHARWFSACVQCLDAESEYSYNVMVTCVELYLERISDLFDCGKMNLKLRERPDGSVYVEDASITQVNCAGELIELMACAVANRITAATAMNAESSRSHAITVVNVTRTHSASGQVTVSELLVVDLAGSEVRRAFPTVESDALFCQCHPCFVSRA